MISIQLLILLSLVQGIAEFLPISSAGHLLLIERYFHLPQDFLAFDLALNLGTLFTILVYFRHHTKTLITETFKVITLRQSLNNQCLLLKLVVATLPVIIVGFILMYFNWEHAIRHNVTLLAACLIIFGIILYLVDARAASRYSFNQITMTQAFIIGLWQCLSLVPGVSRSGSTITAARSLNINRQSAVEFSFLMAIFSTGGAVLLGFIHLIHAHNQLDYTNLLLGTLLSFIFGLIFVHILLRFLANHTFAIFMVYRILLGIALIVFIVYNHF